MSESAATESPVTESPATESPATDVQAAESSAVEMIAAQAPDASAVAIVRRRAPRKPSKPDAVLAAAVDVARRGVLEIAREAEVGDHLGAVPEADRLVTHRFAASVPGYAGWQWFATLARVPRGKEATVCEVGLLPSADSLLAPDWVPWAERVRPEDTVQEDAATEGPTQVDAAREYSSEQDIARDHPAEEGSDVVDAAPSPGLEEGGTDVINSSGDSVDEDFTSTSGGDSPVA